MSSDNSEKVVKWAEDYKLALTNSYSDDAWEYFDHEDLKMHPIWNGYRCKKCRSYCALKNSSGWCIKCIVLKEKIDVLNKMLKELKGGQDK